MKKNRLRNLMFAMCLFLVMLAGCKEKQKESLNKESELVVNDGTKIKIEEIVNMKEDVVISLDDYDYYFYRDNSSISAITFDVYTVKDLKKEDIEVIIDTVIPYSYDVVQEEDEKLEDMTLMSYLGVDWKDLYQMMLEEPDKFEETISTYNETYINIEKIPILHAYSVSVQFDMHKQDFDTETISEVDVVVDGKTYRMDGGSITLDADFSLEREDGGIELDSLAYFEVPIDINREGITVLPEYSFSATEDIRINEFKISHPECSIQSIELQIEENGYIRNEKLDNLNGVEISKGSHVTICATIQSEKLASAFSYGMSGLQIMEYTLVEEDKSQVAYSEFIMRTRLRAFDFYGYYVNDVDILSYYYDYYNPIYGYEY